MRRGKPNVSSFTFIIFHFSNIYFRIVLFSRVLRVSRSNIGGTLSTQGFKRRPPTEITQELHSPLCARTRQRAHKKGKRGFRVELQHDHAVSEPWREKVHDHATSETDCVGRCRSESERSRNDERSFDRPYLRTERSYSAFDGRYRKLSSSCVDCDVL